MGSDPVNNNLKSKEKKHRLFCCAISNNKNVQVYSKKAWLADRFDEGLVFLKSVERGKCFIEYIPAENAWVPILEQTAKENRIPFWSFHLESREEAQNATTPIMNYALFHDGEYVTNEQINDKKFLKLVNG